MSEARTDDELPDTSVTHDDGVNYLDNLDGCKAILPKRGGEWNLQMVCGKRRTHDRNGATSSYCRKHLRLYTNN